MATLARHSQNFTMSCLCETLGFKGPGNRSISSEKGKSFLFIAGIAICTLELKDLVAEDCLPKLCFIRTPPGPNFAQHVGR